MPLAPILRGVFVRRVATLLTGSVLAQGMPVLAAPLLTRMFAPEEMGLLGLFVAASTILGTVSTLRYENAILLPRQESDALALAVLGVGLSVCLSLVAAVALLGAGEPFRVLLGLQPLGSLWIWIPLGGAALGVFQVLNAWQVRSQRFKTLALAKVAQSTGVTAIQLGAGLVQFGAAGLCGGQVLGQLAGIAVLAGNLARDGFDWSRMRFETLLSGARRYRRFPVFSLPADLINVLVNQLPLFLMGYYFGPVFVGFYALTQRVLAAPVAMVGNAVLDVFKERAAADFRETGSCRELYRRTLGVLSAMAAAPSLLLFVFGPELFAWVFGEQWREAGHYARLLAPMLLVRFVASPLGYVFYIAQKQNVDLAWQACLLVVTAGSIVIGGLYDSPRLGIGLFSAAYASMYVVYLLLSYRFAGAGAPASEAA
ncbi:MAG: lipopolysaccharide biosynthesis protein [Burkholderiaceae bacterium]|nr:lipopolysaccharide biosynthesis protein [Burkholderiaceae bacterium]